ncbi:hypothetical protein OG21DRAFT_1400042, partial [Imleria badia]
AHRQELYDDHMRDSNWKKLVGLAKSLCKKYKAASDGVNLTNAPFEELTKFLDPEKVSQWSKDAQNAEKKRGEALNIY